MLRALVLSAATVATAVLGTVSAGGTASAAQSDLARSVRPMENFNSFCIDDNASVMRCDRSAIRSIDRGRAEEGLPAIAIPTAYYSYSTTEQIMFLANKERAIRGLPSMAANAHLNADAQTGASEGRDPSGPSDYAWGSNIAWGYRTPLAADFGWMYDDGPGSYGTNIACTGSTHSGCWGHRDNILAPWSGAQGAGAIDQAGTLQLTQIFVQNY